MNDEAAIKDTIQTYFDSMYESSADKVHEAFHAHARITGYIDNELHAMTTAEFADFVASQQPSPKENNETLFSEIISLEIAGETAIARIRDDYLGLRFLDSISLLKSDGKWSIYNKLFHVEGPAG
ncbi:MAG: nuclear transport factor 2 family protein [Gammaproteobacteria bacterium]|nr:nuclear transport factor 2 family protein [Gammaproteobacteria bacterium]NNJ72717.1 nuclear transport factor 2 family protein [Enterobacterales bacterium]